MPSRFLTPFGRGSGDPLLSIYREMNRMFDDVLGTALSGPGGRQASTSLSAPSLDVHESGDELHVSAELPGVKTGEVDVRLDGDTLTISGEKKNEHEHKQSNVHVMERSYGRFSRSMQLPFTPDPDQVHADFENGVLTIRMKRNAQQQGSRRIEVRSGEAQNGQLASSGAAGPTGSTASTGSTGQSPASNGGTSANSSPRGAQDAGGGSAGGSNGGTGASGSSPGSSAAGSSGGGDSGSSDGADGRAAAANTGSTSAGATTGL